jgi:carbon storage regulator
MLVLSRKPSQQILVGSEIRITVVRIDRNQVRLGIQAPPGIPILRHELTEKPPRVLGHSSCEGGGAPAGPGLARQRRAEHGRGRAAKPGAQARMPHDS